jgi:hypothetical protein
VAVAIVFTLNATGDPQLPYKFPASALGVGEILRDTVLHFCPDGPQALLAVTQMFPETKFGLKLTLIPAVPCPDRIETFWGTVHV